MVAGFFLVLVPSLSWQAIVDRLVGVSRNRETPANKKRRCRFSLPDLTAGGAEAREASDGDGQSGGPLRGGDAGGAAAGGEARGGRQGRR